MHKVLVPKRCGAHRAACLSLYRALLQQCGPSTKTASWLVEPRSLVRHNFRKYKSLQSPSQMANALKAGYNALDLISSSQTNPEHQSRIANLLLQAKSERDRYASRLQKTRPVAPSPKPLTPRQARKAESIRFQEETARPHPNAKSILDRPQPLNGTKRHIPVLVNARGLPFLRIKKPQPKNISNLIRKKLHNRYKWIQRRENLRIDLAFAQDEESWDSLTGVAEMPTWSKNTEDALIGVNAQISNFDMRAKKLAEDMWKVVLAEKAMAEEEEAASKQEK